MYYNVFSRVMECTLVVVIFQMFNKLPSPQFSCVSSVIDLEFRPNIVKAVDRRVDP